jgi:hypothetical protein
MSKNTIGGGQEEEEPYRALDTMTGIIAKMQLTSRELGT